jgi:hypothetical protein
MTDNAPIELDMRTGTSASASAADMLRKLEFAHGRLHFYADYVRGRCMKTAIEVGSGGEVALLTFVTDNCPPLFKIADIIDAELAKIGGQMDSRLDAGHTENSPSAASSPTLTTTGTGTSGTGPVSTRSTFGSPQEAASFAPSRAVLLSFSS